MADNNYFFNLYKNNKKLKDIPVVTDETPLKKAEKITFEKIEKKVPEPPQKPRFIKEEVKPTSKSKLSAIFLILVGVDKAVSIAKTFQKEDLDKIIPHFLQIEVIKDSDKSSVEQLFGKLGEINLSTLITGKDFLRLFLHKLYGPAQGAEELVKYIKEEQAGKLAFLDPIPPKKIKKVLDDENPYVISTILSMLDPKKASEILKILDKSTAAGVIKQLSEKREINSKVLDIIVEKLKEKALDLQISDQPEFGGKDKLVEILKKSKSDDLRNLIDSINQKDKELADELKEEIFTFNDIPLMPRKDLELVLKKQTNSDIAFMLKGTSKALKTIFLTCVSKRRKTAILEEIEFLGKVKKSEVEEKQKEFVNHLLILEEAGKIILREDSEEYVE